MKDVLTYKGFVGSVQFLSKEEKFVGKVMGVNVDTTFEGESHSSLLKSFHEAVDNYLSQNEEQYTGTLSCPISKDLHSKLLVAATKNGVTLNQYIIDILQK